MVSADGLEPFFRRGRRDETLKVNLENLAASLNWLRRSFDSCIKIGIKPEYGEDEFGQFENLTSRYVRTTDLLVNRLLRKVFQIVLLVPSDIDPLLGS
ncbi:hypothetical protein AGMMS49546_34570 [Spirochaetia bacterium]|nr:hypothetical protein AGMMS49546_34570 [Spirochaetia bacterium]